MKFIECFSCESPRPIGPRASARPISSRVGWLPSPAPEIRFALRFFNYTSFPLKPKRSRRYELMGPINKREKRKSLGLFLFLIGSAMTNTMRGCLIGPISFKVKRSIEHRGFPCHLLHPTTLGREHTPKTPQEQS